MFDAHSRPSGSIYSISFLAFCCTTIRRGARRRKVSSSVECVIRGDKMSSSYDGDDSNQGSHCLNESTVMCIQKDCCLMNMFMIGQAHQERRAADGILKRIRRYVCAGRTSATRRRSSISKSRQNRTSVKQNKEEEKKVS